MLIAAVVTALWSLKPLSVGFALVGLAACVPAFLVRDGRTYWLALFLFILPFNLAKYFGSKQYVLSLLETVGGTWGVLSPLLQVSDLLFLILVGGWMIQARAPRRLIFLPRVSLLPLAYVAWVAVGSPFAPQPSLTLFEVMRQAKFVAIYLFTSSAVSPRRQGKLVLGVLLLGLLVQSGVTVVRYQSQSVSTLFGGMFGEVGESIDDMDDARLEAVTRASGEDVSATRRGVGTLPHPNGTAMHLEMTLPMALALVLFGRWRSEKWLYLGLWGLGVVALYVTFSRGGMGGFVVSVVVCITVAAAKGLMERRTVVAVSVVSALLAPVLVVKAAPYFTTRPDYTNLHVLHLDAGLRMIQINPLLGVGLNNSTALRSAFTEGGESLIESSVPFHSHYLLIAVETGLVGFALYYLFFVAVGVEAARRCARGSLHERVLALGVLGCYVALGVNTVMDYVGADGLQTFLWFYAGLVVALVREEREPSAGDRREPERSDRLRRGLAPMTGH